MKSIRGLILKDILNLSNYKATLVATVLIFSLLAILQKDTSSFLPTMIIIMIGMIAFSTFRYDEIAKTDKFILTLPTNRKEIVKAKYIFVICLTIIGAIIAFLINFIIYYFIFKKTFNPVDSISITLGAIFIVGIIECIQIPNIYKYGAEKGKIQMFIIFAVIAAIFGGFMLLTKNLNIHFNMKELNNILNTYGIPIALVVTTFMYFISYKISNKIYSKKEIE